MSKQKTLNVFGRDIQLPGIPESAEEYTAAAAGDSGALLRNAVNSDINAWKQRFKTNLSAELHKTHKRKTQEKDGKTTFVEGQKEHWDRALANGLTTEQAQALIDQVVASTPYRPVGTDIGQTWLDKAEAEIENMQTVPDGVAKFVAYMQTNNPSVSIELDDQGVPTVDSVALALKVETTRKEAEDRKRFYS